MTNNKPNVKLPEHKTKCICDSCDEIRAYAEDYARAAIALNTPGVDAQGKVEATLRDVLAYVGNRTDGDLITLAGRAEHWMRGSKSLIDMQLDLLRLRGSKPAPTGAYAAKLNELVNKWRGNAKSHEIKADREGQSDDIRNWHQGADQAFGDCANELSTALAALAEGEEEHDRKWANYGTPVDESKVTNVEGEKGNG